MEDIRTETPPRFSNRIFGMFIESLGDDPSSLRACSLVSSTFRHFCSPILYRNIGLDHEKTVDAFIQDGPRSDLLQHIKSLSLTCDGFWIGIHLRKPHRILDVALRKASLDTLRLHNVQFQVEPLAASTFSKLSTVTTLILQDCRFGIFRDFVSFIRGFPRCEVLRLRGCDWIRRAELELMEPGGLPSYDVAPVHLEITSAPIPYGYGEYRDQGRIVGMPWLDLTGLKSFTYTIEDAEPVLEKITACELLEEIDVDLSHPESRDFVINQLTSLVARIKFLTLRCDDGLCPWWAPYYNTELPPSPALERVRIVLDQLPTTEDCKILDATFSDIDRYPSLKQLDLCLPPAPKGEEKGKGTHGGLEMKAYFPRLKAMGRLIAW